MALDDHPLNSIPASSLVTALAAGTGDASVPSSDDIGVYQFSVGAAWVDVASVAFESLTVAGNVDAGAPMIEVTFANTHGTQTLYALLRANAAEATTVALPIGPGGVATIPCNLSAQGADVVAVAIYGSGAATTGYISARFGSV